MHGIPDLDARSQTCGEKLTREWRRDDGAAMKIERCLIDANWGNSTDVVYQFCRQTPHAAVVMPSHGRYVGAASVPFSDYKPKRGDRVGLRRFLGLTVLGGACFLGMQAREWTHLISEGMTLTSKGLFGSTFFVLTGFHGCHVFSGVVYLSTILANAGEYSADNHNAVEIAGLYWHFVDLVWILIFTFVYLI